MSGGGSAGESCWGKRVAMLDSELLLVQRQNDGNVSVASDPSAAA